jgi:hypothetical protein
MLLGIKARAEGQPDRPPALALIAAAGWAMGGLGVLWALLRLRWGRVAGLLPTAYFVAILLSTADLLSATAGFIALGLPLAGFVSYGRRWWPSFSLIAAYVLLVLLLAEDAFVAFGLSLLVIVLLLILAALRRIPAIQLA